jgi:hypothetical protein
VVYDRDFETNAALSHTDIPLTLATREDAQEHCDRLNGVLVLFDLEGDSQVNHDGPGRPLRVIS